MSWIEVDTSTRTLTVYGADGSRLAHFDNISVGRGGVSPLHYHGDESTPIGRYHIRQIRPSSRFDTFILLDYPQPQHAELAFQAGRIDGSTRDAIEAAAMLDAMPPQNTALGGEIGIHGVGRGSLRIHSLYNWTNGCVALTNSQLHQLLPKLRNGMLVVIH